MATNLNRCYALLITMEMATEFQKKEDIDIFRLKQRIISMISDYNSRAYNLENSRKSKLGNLFDSDKIPKLQLREV